MQTVIPKTSTVFSALLRADVTTQWRNRRSFILILIVPVIILISWKGLIDKAGGAFVISNSITIGLVAIGLMGYTNSIARDREKGIFQRLRVAPAPNWCIMASRLMIQLGMILLVTIGVFIGGHYFDQITLAPLGYILGFFAALVGGAVYLGLGQVIVGLIKNPETVNSTSRLVYFAFIMVGTFGETGYLGKELQNIVHWTPYGTVSALISASLEPGKWTSDTTTAFFLTILYAAFFATVGIQKFQWDTK